MLEYKGIFEGNFAHKKTISIYSDTQKGELEGHFANNIVQVFTSRHPTYRARNIFNQTAQVFALL